MNGNKVAIVLQAGSEGHEGMARALHGLLYAKELAEHDIPVRLVFDGAGTEWAAQLHRSDGTAPGRLVDLSRDLKERGVVYEVCDFCSGAFGVHDELKAAEAPFSAKYLEHPSIASFVEEDYQVWIL